MIDISSKVSVKEIRSKIADVYGVSFAASLKPRQVFAVWNSIQKRNKKPEDSEFHQMDIFEWMRSLEIMKGEHIETYR